MPGPGHLFRVGLTGGRRHHTQQIGQTMVTTISPELYDAARQSAARALASCKSLVPPSADEAALIGKIEDEMRDGELVAVHAILEDADIAPVRITVARDGCVTLDVSDIVKLMREGRRVSALAEFVRIQKARLQH